MSESHNSAPAQSDSVQAPSKRSAEETTPSESTSESRNRGRGRGGRGRSNGRGKRGGRGVDRRGDMGRREYNRDNRRSDNRAKRTKLDDDEDEAGEKTEDGEKEERKPKRKVAVLMSYCGTGYKGMQVNPGFKSIEGDLFDAMVKAGAISKANSTDPKKSSLVRCARTDKGVHAAGNVISLKLIIEDPDVVVKINEALPPQIRIWDIIRTTGGFSAYQHCDSRKYEYLLPSYMLLPPHPQSYLARQCVKVAEEEGDLEGYNERQKSVEGWWDPVNKAVDEQLLKEGYTREEIDEVMEEVGEDQSGKKGEAELEKAENAESKPEPAKPESKTEAKSETKAKSEPEAKSETEAKDGEPMEVELSAEEACLARVLRREKLHRLIRQLRQQHLNACRIPQVRLDQARGLFASYVGTLNFHNYTVDKNFRDPSAKRHIKSFTISDPFLIEGTEWLSLRVHGQSFMMHQIRKMVGLATMMVRCGTPPSFISDSLGPKKIPIPKAPAVGLLLQNPVFEHYSENTAENNGRDGLTWEKYEEPRKAFVQEWIYGRIYREEKQRGWFRAWSGFLDAYRMDTYMYLTSKGLDAVAGPRRKEGGRGRVVEVEEEAQMPGEESDDERPVKGVEEG